VQSRGADATPLAGIDMLFDYDLPEALIAQEPAPERDRSRLMVVRRAEGLIEHRHFADLPDLLAAGDLLVLNDTRVIPARLIGRRARTGGKWEGLFLHETPDGLWELMSQTRGRLVEGETVVVEPGGLRLTLVRRTPARRWLARPHEPGPALDLLRRHGQVPLPPYVRKGRAAADDTERYQTVYARRPGAVAAPTAGLHFTPRVFERLDGRGISRAFVTLHVGEGTFAPIKVDDITHHQMHREWGELPAATAEAVAATRSHGGRVVAVGTTSVRVLETVAATGPVRPWSGESELFIYLPYEFRLVDALVTNFHLPRTSLLCLVSAFAGVELVRQAYREAVAAGYRFYSYGDAMLIV
jgi:S-adenosylmethionine:tRNA ribosyltransferase-isomerase